MNTIEKLQRLRNTMRMMEVRGENVLILADCIRFLDNFIQEESQKEAVKEQETAEEPKQC